MSRIKQHVITLTAIALLGVLGAHPAKAQMAVIDAANLKQAIQEVISWHQQLQGMEQQYLELQQTYGSLTGPRGMQLLLPIPVSSRNYLPMTYAQLLGVMSGSSAQYPNLAAQVQASVQSNAILPAPQLATFSPSAQGYVTQSRQTAATLNMLAQQSQANASNNFGTLQGLITALGSTQDTKASLDLSGRIQSEQVMTETNQIKTEALYQTIQAQALQNQETAREAAIKMQGSQASLAPISW